MNSLVRLQNPGPNVPAPGTRQGNWVWDGNQWSCCGPDDWGGGVPGCPPPGWPPPGCPPWFSGQNSPPWYPGANAGISFGTNFPPNPVRGHLSWDGSTLWLFDGAVWVPTGGEGVGGGATYGPTPPASPNPGALWFDGNDLLIWTGTAWVHASGGATGTTPPANPSPGTTWWNGSTLMIWDGTAWVSVAGTKTYVQATAPPSPNPGDQWWDGTQMRIWDGTAWRLVGPGATTGPVSTTTQVFAITVPSGSLNTGQTRPNFGMVPFDATPTVNTLSAWTPSNWQFKPNVAGWYNCYINGWGSGGQGWAEIYLFKNDPGLINENTYQTQNIVCTGGINATTFGGGQVASGMTFMNGSTDFLRLWGVSDDGNVYPISTSLPMLNIFLVP